MNLVDSSGWLEYFAAGPNSAFFASALADGERLVVPSISILEVFRRVRAQRDEQAALIAVAAMQQGRVIDLDVEVALMAGRLGIEAHAVERLPVSKKLDHRAGLGTVPLFGAE